jgi:hypothetical protein
MRLLDATNYKIQEFLGDYGTLDYAILSHTWGANEISLQELQDAGVTERTGFVKIKLACEQALRDGLRWVWIDTCRMPCTKAWTVS